MVIEEHILSWEIKLFEIGERRVWSNRRKLVARGTTSSCTTANATSVHARERKARRQAEAFEQAMKEKVKQAAGLKSVKALYETFRDDLTGGKKISLIQRFGLLAVSNRTNTQKQIDKDPPDAKRAQAQSESFNHHSGLQCGKIYCIDDSIHRSADIPGLGADNRR